MSDYVFIRSDEFYYDRDRKILHGTDGNIEIQGRLANVLELFIESPEHRVQLSHREYCVTSSDFSLSKRTFRNYVAEINGLGRKVGLGDSSIIKYRSMPDSTSRWTLQVFGDDSDEVKQNKQPAKTIRITYREGAEGGDLDKRHFSTELFMEACDSGWFSNPFAQDKKELLSKELANYFNALVCNTESVITDYRSEMTVDVSNWPENPYRIKQTITQLIEGSGSEVFVEQCELQDELKASTFRYTSLVLRDEAGRTLLRRSRIPHWSDANAEAINPVPDGWSESAEYKECKLNDPSRPSIERLDYTLEKEGYIVTIRSWPYHSAAFAWTGPQEERPPRQNRQGGFFTADVLVQSPPGRKTSIELTFEYDAWFVSDNRFFTNLVYSPSITARIIGAECNPHGYEFRLRQFSAQSPFWRRDDGKQYVKDVMLAGNTPHFLSWHYPDQWLILGEGYVVAVDAFKAYEGGTN